MCLGKDFKNIYSGFLNCVVFFLSSDKTSDKITFANVNSTSL